MTDTSLMEHPLKPIEDTAELGSSTLRVSRLGVGTVPIGGILGEVSDADAQAVLRRSYELGLRLFDTAPVYGFGLAEQRIGEALQDLPRGEIVLTTKVGRLIRPVSFARRLGRALRDAARQGPRGGAKVIRLKAGRVINRARGDQTVRVGYPFEKGDRGLGEMFDFSYDGAMRSIEESLERLKTDRVDLLFIHDPDHHYNQSMSGAYRALAELRSQGVVKAIGVGMTQSAMLTRFARDGDFDCFLLAGRYTLLDQRALADLLPVCQEKGISLILGGVYNSGILVDPKPGAMFDYEPAAQDWIQKALRIKAVCERHGVPLMAAAIQFPLAHPAVASVLTGVRSVAELETNVRMAGVPIPPEMWTELKAEGLLPADVVTPALGLP
ncbi:aldo/keto reductase [soil metagenome]